MTREGISIGKASCRMENVCKKQEVVPSFLNDRAYIYWLLLPSFLLVLLCSDSSAHRAIAIPINPVQISPIAMGMGFFYCLGRLRKIRLDTTFFLLLLRVPLLLLPLVYTTDLDGYLGNYFSVLVAVFAYFAGSNTRSRDIGKHLYHFIVIVGLVIVVQLSINISSYIADGFSLIYLKNYIDIPLGRSNSIASYLLMLFFFLFFYMKSGLRKNIFLVVVLFGIVATLSTGGVLTLAIVIIIRGLFFTQMQTIKMRGIIDFVVWIILASIVLVALNKLLSGSVLRIFDAANLTLGVDKYSFDDLTSGRGSLFVYSFEKFLAHPVLGNGLGFPAYSMLLIERMRPHNFVLEALTQGGIVNLLIIAVAIITALKKIFHYRNDRVCNAIFWAAVAVLCHGMVEPNLFSFTMDYLFWSMVGFGVARARYLTNMKMGVL